MIFGFIVGTIATTLVMAYKEKADIAYRELSWLRQENDDLKDDICKARRRCKDGE